MHGFCGFCVKWSCAKGCGFAAAEGVVGIRILSPPVPLAFCFDSVNSLMDAVGRAVRTLHVLSSAMARIGSRFFLCVTVRFSERIAARSLFSEYGTYVGAGRFTPAYLSEHGDLFVPDAVRKMGLFPGAGA